MTASDDVVDMLKKVMRKEKIQVFTAVKATANPAGDGCMGDVIFVEAVGRMADGSRKDYSLVLKCGKRGEALRASTPTIRAVYVNEINVYDQLFPKFTAFQMEKGVEDVFDSIPKCYGTFLDDDMEVLALENLKDAGYYLWDKREPLTRQHLHVVLKAYGKWHAISAAMNDQRPGDFNDIAKFGEKIWSSKSGKEDIAAVKIFSDSMKAMYQVMKDHLSINEKEKWLSVEKRVPDYFDPSKSKPDELKVMVHGDCWSNNFMYKDDDKGMPSKVAILDWQVAVLASPAKDLSYFLHTCSSEEDLKDYRELLKVYHKSFSDHTRKLGSDPEKLYPFSELLKSWRRAVPYGVILASMIMKSIYAKPDNVPNIEENAARGGDFASAFNKGEIFYVARAVARMGYIFRSAIADGVL